MITMVDQEERCERTILAGDFNAGLDELVYLLVSWSMTKKIIMNLRSLPSLPINATITVPIIANIMVPIIAIIATIMVPIIAVNIKVKEKGGLESAYNQVLSKEPEYTTWKVMTMILAITILHKTM